MKLTMNNFRYLFSAKTTLLLLSTLLATSVVAQDAAGNQEEKNSFVYQREEFHERGGLPNTFYKIANQRQVKIAYIGGSITEASEGWRSLTFSWFRLNYPQTAFYEINATIGGTGSNLGVFRLERDVLEHDPDLIFVEFAVNDGGPREKVLRSVDGMIRKIRKDNPQTDICLVYTAAEVHIKKLVKGELKPAVIAMEELADYYQLPSIDMGVEIAKLYLEEKLVLVADPSENANTIVFTQDHTHPLKESGHPIYAATVVKYLEQMSKTAKSVNYSLPAPYVDDSWENATMVDISSTELSGTWHEVDEDQEIAAKFGRFMPVIYKGAPGSTMRFTFEGNVLGFYDVVGPKTGIIEITVDGQTQEKFRFDQWCDNYRKSNFFIPDLEEGIHEVEVKVTDQSVDKAQILSKKKITITDPTRYDGTSWFPANVMIVGKLLDQ